MRGDGAPMERWSVGMKHAGTRVLAPEERRRIARLRHGFRMRAVKLGVACALWFPLILLMAEYRERLRGFEEQALLVWAIGMFVVPLFFIRWVVAGVTRAIRLTRDLHNGTIEILKEVATPAQSGSREGSDAAYIVEALPLSAFVVTINGIANERWILAPVGYVAGPARSAWLDFFSGASTIDRIRERAMTEAERIEIGALVRRDLKALLQMWSIMIPLIGLLLAIRASFGNVPEARQLILYIVVVALLPTTFATSVRMTRARALAKDRERNAVGVVSFGEALRAKGAPESLEYLGVSRRLWSLNGMPAHWRILSTFNEGA